MARFGDHNGVHGQGLDRDRMRCFIAGVWWAHREKFRSSVLPPSIVAGAIYPAMDHLSLPRETAATQVLEPDDHKVFIHRQHCARNERVGAADHRHPPEIQFGVAKLLADAGFTTGSCR